MSSSNIISILGSTGSIGQSTLDVIANNPSLHVYALSAHKNVELLLQQCLKFRPEFAVVTDSQAAEKFATILAASDCDTEMLFGGQGLDRIAADNKVDTVVAAIVGAAGLQSTLVAVENGKKILLANKESLVMSGDLMMQKAQQNGAVIIPTDSEHNAIFQCLPQVEKGLAKSQMKHVKKIVLTASGGPFLHTAHKELEQITPEEACKHPNWEMGQKISVDSATMMNKGLEVIEACHLFGLSTSTVEVLCHPQSVVHSMVYYRDGSVLAQMGNPDMRIPIASGLAWPERMESGVNDLDLGEYGRLEFLPPDLEKFPCLQLGIEAAEKGGTTPAILNAANEVAVAAFLTKRVGFLQIPLIIKAVLSKIPCEAASSIAIIQDVDEQARLLANELISKDFS